MALILVLVVGGSLGWLASIVMLAGDKQGALLNIVIGIIGAVLAGFLITPLVSGAPITSGSLDAMSLLSSFLGALVLLAVPARCSPLSALGQLVRVIQHCQQLRPATCDTAFDSADRNTADLRSFLIGKSACTDQQQRLAPIFGQTG